MSIENRKLVIVGGGYAGIRIAAALDDVMDITLIERRERFVHNIALIRAVTDPSWLDTLLLPYGGLLERGRVVRAEVSGINAGRVLLQDGSELPADDIVLATGSSYPTPFKATRSIPDLVKAVHDNHARLQSARSVVIVGAGPVGIELAGEIAAAFQDKQITLVAATQELLPDLGTKLGYALARQLQDMGVRLLMGRRAVELASTEAPFGPAHVKLDDGTQVAADLVFPVIGAKPVATFPTGTAITLHRGRIRVNSDLSVVNLPGVWALGDAADTGDPMSVVSLERQVPYLIKQLRARATGAAPPSKPYQGWLNPPAVVPLGPRKGASRLPGKLVVGSWMTSLIKGRHLLVNKARKSLGVKTDTQGRTPDVI